MVAYGNGLQNLLYVEIRRKLLQAISMEAAVEEVYILTAQRSKANVNIVGGAAIHMSDQFL